MRLLASLIIVDTRKTSCSVTVVVFLVQPSSDGRRSFSISLHLLEAVDKVYAPKDSTASFVTYGKSIQPGLWTPYLPAYFQMQSPAHRPRPG